MEPCMTSASHLYIALASSCFAYLLLILPATTKLHKYPYLLIYAIFFLYCILFPIITIYTGAINTNISGENTFILIKFLSVIAFLLILLYFSVHSYAQTAMFKGYHIMSVVFVVLLSANIFEAVIDQGIESNLSTYDGKINIVGTVIGLLLIASLFYSFPKMSIKSTNKLQLVSNLTFKFIVAYTLWNLLFRIQLVENSSILLFTCVSLIVPIICHVTKTGDWLETRGLTLLLVMLLTMGIGTGQANIFPGYNTSGYRISENKDIATQIFSNDIVKGILTSIAFISVLYSFRK